MKIVAVELGWLRAELRTPFKTALRTVNELQDLIVRVTTATGAVGYGEAPPTAAITGETLETLVVASGAIARTVLPAGDRELPELCRLVAQATGGNGSAKAAMEIALYDAAAQEAGVPLYKFLNPGATERVLETDLTISVNSPEEMVCDAEEALKRGFKFLKVKIGKDFLLDQERIIQVSQKVGNRALLALDVNQAWNVEESLKALEFLRSKKVKLRLIEQPVKADDRTGLQQITRRKIFPILADEAVFSPDDADYIWQNNCADMVNIKLMKSGGLSGAEAIIRWAKHYNSQCMMGCMLEGAVSVAAAAHFAAAHREYFSWIDLDGPALCRTNPVCGGTVFTGSKIELNTEPGLGIRDITNLEIFQVYK